MNNVGAKKAYQCKEGYREETGRKSSTCQANGLWDYEPTCYQSKQLFHVDFEF